MVPTLKMYDMSRCDPTVCNTYQMSNLPGLEINPPLSVEMYNQISSYNRSATHTSSQGESNPKSAKEGKAIARLLKNLPILDEHFVLHKKIGEGTYSTVYLASYKNSKSSKQFAVKHLTNNFSLSRIQKEMRFMQIIGGCENVVNVLNCFKSYNKECIVFIMPYLPHKRFSEYVLEMDAAELKLYMKNLFVALRRVHSFGVIHRDVKPGNFLYSRSTKEFLLVDFGLAQEASSSPKCITTREYVDEENVPINYSKRKRSNNDDYCLPAKRMIGQSPLQSCENTMAQNNLRRSTCSQVPKLPFMMNNVHLSPLSPDDNNSRLAPSSSYESSNGLNLSVNASSGISFRSNGTSILTSHTENLSDHAKNFTPLIGNVSTDNFVVRNSQVVKKENSGCTCNGIASICCLCAAKRPLAAPRAGTPGFRPPEVLLKCLYQTPAVDMWAAGIVLLCVLSGTYPFFKSPNDLAALMEIITIFGTEAVQGLSHKLGRNLPCSSYRKPLDLRKMCRRRRARFLNKAALPPTEKCRNCLQNIRDDGCVCYTGPVPCSNFHTNGDKFPDSAYHLLTRLLDLDPDSRITAAEALHHPFIAQV